MAEFWHEVELATNVRQQRMFQAVNAHLEKLARAVDDVVGGLLSLRLEPVLVRMEPPSAAEFHSSLQELFEKGALPAHPAFTCLLEGPPTCRVQEGSRGALLRCKSLPCSSAHGAAQGP